MIEDLHYKIILMALLLLCVSGLSLICKTRELIEAMDLLKDVFLDYKTQKFQSIFIPN